MKAITPERARHLCELYNFKLAINEYLDTDDRCGCYLGLLTVDHFRGDIEKADEALDSVLYGTYAELGNLLGEPPSYLQGLDMGFEGEYTTDVQVEIDSPDYMQEFWRGYIDGSELGIAYDKGEVPIMPREDDEFYRQNRTLSRNDMRKYALEAVKSPEIVES